MKAKVYPLKNINKEGENGKILSFYRSIWCFYDEYV